MGKDLVVAVVYMLLKHWIPYIEKWWYDFLLYCVNNY